MSSNIYLIGMMGTGKTVTGRRLADRLKCGFVDLDGEIEKAAGCGIPEIFAGKGESWFRDLETQTLSRFSEFRRQVVSTGGGIVLRPENILRMKKSGTVVFLKASCETLLKRLEGSRNRPLLEAGDRKEKIERLLRERTPLYEGAADCVVATDQKSMPEIITDILAYLEPAR